MHRSSGSRGRVREHRLEFRWAHRRTGRQRPAVSVLRNVPRAAVPTRCIPPPRPELGARPSRRWRFSKPLAGVPLLNGRFVRGRPQTRSVRGRAGQTEWTPGADPRGSRAGREPANGHRPFPTAPKAVAGSKGLSGPGRKRGGWASRARRERSMDGSLVAASKRRKPFQCSSSPVARQVLSRHGTRRLGRPEGVSSPPTAPARCGATWTARCRPRSETMSPSFAPTDRRTKLLGRAHGLPFHRQDHIRTTRIPAWPGERAAELPSCTSVTTTPVGVGSGAGAASPSRRPPALPTVTPEPRRSDAPPSSSPPGPSPHRGSTRPCSHHPRAASGHAQRDVAGRPCAPPPPSRPSPGERKAIAS